MFKLCVLAVIALAAFASADESRHCPTTAVLWPVDDDCRSYFNCGNGESIEKCFPLLRRFSRVTLKCEWAWKVDCSAKPTPPSDVGLLEVVTCNEAPQSRSPRRRKITPFPLDINQAIGPLSLSPSSE